MADASEDPLRIQQLKWVEQAIEQFGPRVRDRVAVVTGGARGVGQGMARGLLQAGARVVVADKTWDGSEAWLAELEDSGRGLGTEMDITDDAQIQATLDAVLQKFGTVDALFNNAALVSETLFRPTGRVKMLDTTDEDWEFMFRVNVFGTVKVIRHFIQPMQKQKSGSIVNVVSTGMLASSHGGGYVGERPWSLEMPYQATKGSVASASFYLAEEVREDGIAVNVIAPGHTRASWFDTTALAHRDRGSVYSMRPVVPEHIAPITLFLAGQNASGATGRLYITPEWNMDQGFGTYREWQDRWLTPELEKYFSDAEAATTPAPRMSFARPS